MDAEEAAGPSHSDAYEAFQTAMNWLERQLEGTATQLVRLKRLRDMAANKQFDVNSIKHSYCCDVRQGGFFNTVDNGFTIRKITETIKKTQQVMAQLISVKLSRFDATPWGFRLQGGKDFGSPLVIQKLLSNYTPETLEGKETESLIAVSGQLLSDCGPETIDGKEIVALFAVNGQLLSDYVSKTIEGKE
uniref:Uncharacterized protein n=1 Tax=Timema cristinae TaxID=61476 RepID=A0A7R9CGM8_TIMCR|nr:unnamed protein product [Timema cristinae]